MLLLMISIKLTRRGFNDNETQLNDENETCVELKQANWLTFFKSPPFSFNIYNHSKMYNK